MTNQWQRWEDKAENMTAAELIYAIKDCVEASDAAENLWRAGVGNGGGRYRDECSVYRRALEALKKEECPMCDGVGIDADGFCVHCGCGF